MELLNMTETVRGEGTFVAQNPELIRSLRAEMAQEALQQFLQEMRALGFDGSEIRALVDQALTGDGGGGASRG